MSLVFNFDQNTTPDQTSPDSWSAGIGSGKSFFCKMEMGSVFLSGDDEIIVIDPMNEYFDIAETYGGTVVNMSTYTDNYMNPLEMDV